MPHHGGDTGSTAYSTAPPSLPLTAKMPLVAGVVGGVVGLAIITVLVLRFRKGGRDQDDLEHAVWSR